MADEPEYIALINTDTWETRIIPRLPVPNVPELRKQVAWVEEQAQRPEDEREWNQFWWATRRGESCGTAFCLGGNTVASQPGYGGLVGTDELVSCAKLDGETVLIEDAATRILGLTYDEADELFRASNSAEDIRRIAEQIAERAGERL